MTQPPLQDSQIGVRRRAGDAGVDVLHAGLEAFELGGERLVRGRPNPKAIESPR